MSAVIEENPHGVIRQLVAKAVLVGVVHPFSHPLKTAAAGGQRSVVCCEKKKNCKLEPKQDKSINSRSSSISTKANIKIKETWR